MKKANNEIGNIVAKPTHAVRPMITLVAAVRAGRDRSSIELALDNTGQWVPIPRALIGEVEELGNMIIGGVNYPAVDIDIMRPKEGDPWFDLLAFMMSRIGQLKVPGRECGCRCGGHDKGDRAGGTVHKRARRKVSKTTVANCVSCWIMTMGSAEGFCYRYGHCDN